MKDQKQSYINNAKNKGFIAILTSILVVIIMVTVGVSVANLIITQQKISTVSARSLQAYFAADSGIEDAIYRIREGISIQDNYSFQLAGISVDVDLSESIGGSRTITSEAAESGVIKKIGAVHTFDSESVQFFFGAQVGEAGITMADGSRVIGNVYSNGVISGTGEVTAGQITNNVIVSGASNKVDGVLVGGDVKTHNCYDTDITGDLYYVSGGIVSNCPAEGSTFEITDPVPVEPLPISQEQIDAWKTEALQGGVSVGDRDIEDNTFIGPLKIDGKVIVKSEAILTLQGVLWVTGEFKVSNDAIIQLDSGVYGSASGVIIVGPDSGPGNRIELENNARINGSGQAGSYLLLLNTTSLNPAILIKNGVVGGIFYTPNGIIKVENDANVIEVTGYGLELSNNAVIEYEVGLANLFFSGGPGGSWTVDSWREVN